MADKLFDVLLGRAKKDIQLPNQSGRIDPRLKRPDVAGQLRKAGEGLKSIVKQFPKK